MLQQYSHQQTGPNDSFPKEGDPNIDPNILWSLLWGPQNGTPNFGKPPNSSEDLKLWASLQAPQPLPTAKAAHGFQGLGFRV